MKGDKYNIDFFIKFVHNLKLSGKIKSFSELAEKAKIKGGQSRLSQVMNKHVPFTPDFADQVYNYFPVDAVAQLASEPKQKYAKPIIESETITNKSGNKYYENPNGGFIIKAPLVPFPAYASFINVYADEYQMNEDFQKAFFTVDHVGRELYVAFRVTNDSMNDGSLDGTPSGAEVLGRELIKSLWQYGFNPTRYGWVLVTSKGIMFKDIVSDIQENGTIKLHSRNPSPEYFDFELGVNEIHSIFKVIKRTF